MAKLSSEHDALFHFPIDSGSASLYIEWRRLRGESAPQLCVDDAHPTNWREWPMREKQLFLQAAQDVARHYRGN